MVLDVREQGLEETVRLVREAGGEAVGVPADVRSEADIQRVVDTALLEFGQIDILWNNASILTKQFTPAEALTLDEWNDTRGEPDRDVLVLSCPTPRPRAGRRFRSLLLVFCTSSIQPQAR